jgi:hypothetical protein
MNCELMLTYDTPALRQTGSRNLTGQKMLPTIWGTYMKLVTKYQISAINSRWEKCDEKCAYMYNVYQIPTSCLPILLIFIHIEHICSFFLATIDDRNLISGHKLHIGMLYCGKRFWTCQIPTSCLPILLIFIHIEHICSFFSATIDDRNLIFGHKLHIGMLYCGKRFWTCQIPTSCLPT